MKLGNTRKFNQEVEIKDLPIISIVISSNRIERFNIHSSQAKYDETRYSQVGGDVLRVRVDMDYTHLIHTFRTIENL